MHDAIMLAALAPACAVLNRFRGGGLYADRLPGHPRFYVSAVLGLMCWPLFGWMAALSVAASYLCWSFLPWGRWFDLGRLPDDFVARKPNDFEILIGRLPNDHVRFTVRNLIGLLPAAVLISPLMLMLAPAQTAAYEIGWQTTPRVPTVTGEWITGALWGAFIWWLA
jgi:hypothetical protein